MDEGKAWFEKEGREQKTRVQGEIGKRAGEKKLS